MSDFTAVFTFFGTQLANAFSMFDEVYFMDTGFTLLDILLAVLFLQLIIWFIGRIRNEDEGEEDESSGIWDRILSRS